MQRQRNGFHQAAAIYFSNTREGTRHFGVWWYIPKKQWQSCPLKHSRRKVKVRPSEDWYREAIAYRVVTVGIWMENSRKAFREVGGNSLNIIQKVLRSQRHSTATYQQLFCESTIDDMWDKRYSMQARAGLHRALTCPNTIILGVGGRTMRVFFCHDHPKATNGIAPSTKT